MLRLQFETTTPAFDDEPATEIARILRETACKIEAGQFAGTLRDARGILIGGWTINEPKAKGDGA